MKVWWLGDELRTGNFGDILTPHILNYFNVNFSRVINYNDADAICVGSIARRAKTNTVVLGSGILSIRDKLDPTANWKFVRGPLTRKRLIDCKGTCPEIYGDPALLLPVMYKPIIVEKLETGYVPHFVDFNIVNNTYSNVVKLKTRNYKEVVNEIIKYKKIVSSSLHGIIVAHAYGIPAAWVSPINSIKGDNVKFEDYFLSVGITNFTQSTYDNPIFIEPGKIDLNPIIKIFEDL